VQYRTFQCLKGRMLTAVGPGFRYIDAFLSMDYVRLALRPLNGCEFSSFRVGLCVHLVFIPPETTGRASSMPSS
jgi:hypothetical protein